MIYLITAMYAEAQPFITHFQLKKDISHTHFQVFKNREADLCLIISGTGSIPAAVAVSNICTAYGAGSGDFLLNVGICAKIEAPNTHCIDNHYPVGTVFLCNKIQEQATGKTFYPDILYRHTFIEAEIVTGSKPYHKTGQTAIRNTNFYLYDMEAASIYQAGAYYLGPHQMSFLKVLSDYGNPENITPGQIESLIGQNIDPIADYITRFQTIVRQEKRQIPFEEDMLQKELEKLCLDMHCSKTMSESVRQHIRYYILSGIDYHSVIQEMYQRGQLPCKEKKEGKQCFEELKQRLL